ncbi:MAG: transposase [Firmicutes bacterium]|nr:transposase [Bacillota bacterium]
MPRIARKRSSSGIYHVVLRGINRQRIFEDDQDNQKYLKTIKRYKKTSGYEVYAYCLMSNHIHLLMKEGKEDLGITFRRIGASYVYWYNWKYSRRGHLFQDRYKSEVVETDSYFLTVMRYIHQNPTKAGIVKEIQAYPWSSYGEYTKKAEICDTRFALSLFTANPKDALSLWKKFNQESSDDNCLEYDDRTRLNDLEAAELIQNITGVKSPSEIQNFEKYKKNNVIKKLKRKGLSIRQIERLTGVSFGVIRGI